MLWFRLSNLVDGDRGFDLLRPHLNLPWQKVTKHIVGLPDEFDRVHLSFIKDDPNNRNLLLWRLLS